MLKKTKRFLALFVVGALLCGYIPVDGIVMQVKAADETGETLSVSFDQPYAEVGEELSVTVTGATDVSYKWTVDGENMDNNTDSYIPTEDDLEKWIEVIVIEDGTEMASTKLYCSKLPVVYIDTNGQQITSKEDYIDATMTIQGNATYDPDTTTLYNGAIEIRGRGNTTWTKPKKPYKIKLDKKTDVFGMGKNKHWVLLANYLDESLMRNTLTYDLSGSMGMEQMSTVWVDVVMNGEYAGNYQFCEQVRVDDTRVDVFDWEGFAEDSAEIIAEAEGLDEGDLGDYMLENMGWITSGQVEFEGKTYQISNYEEIEIPSINGGYILELDEYYDEVSKFKTKSSQPIMFKNPEFVYTNEDMMAYVQAYVQGFENAVQSSDYTATYEGKVVHYSDLYDFDALVDYWLLNEIFYNEEFNKKSTYMYKEIDGLMKMGPMWDMDWSSGAAGTSATATNRWATLNFNANAQRNQWYKNLVKDPYFLMKVQERYWEIRDVQVQDMLDSIDVHYEYLKESGAADTAVWTSGGCGSVNSERTVTFDEDVDNLKDWLTTHIAWMDQNMATEDSLDASFMSKNNNLSLKLTDIDGNDLDTDVTEKAPADAVDKTGKDLKLKISGNTAGKAEIYVNGRICDAVQLTTAGAEYVIAAEKLSAEVGTKNIIEVKVRNTSNTVIAENYITVKGTEVEEVPVETAIISQPANYEGIIGDTASFTVEAVGSGLTYQWQYKNATAKNWYDSSMNGSNSNTINVPITNARDGQQYRCIITDAAGAQFVSETATLNVVVSIEITAQPENYDGIVGNTATFAVEAIGNGLAYQWQYKNPTSAKWYNSSMNGSNTKTIYVPITNARDGQQYRCIITDVAGNQIISEVAALAIVVPIEITAQPDNYNGFVGDTATFTVGATGDGLIYQWQYKNATSSIWRTSSMKGNATPTITVPITAGRNGQQYRCIITDGSGNSIISDVVTLSVL